MTTHPPHPPIGLAELYAIRHANSLEELRWRLRDALRAGGLHPSSTEELALMIPLARGSGLVTLIQAADFAYEARERLSR